MRYYKNGSTVRFKARGLLDHGLTPKPRAEGSSPSALRNAINPNSITVIGDVFGFIVCIAH